MLHAGDSYFHHVQLDATPRAPLVLRYFQRRVDMDRNARVANQARPRELKLGHGGGVTIFNSHDPLDY